ncbi:hypothetical protein PHAVU_003G221225 [Phaseolus vulgaris]
MSVSKCKRLSLCLVSWLWFCCVAVASGESSIGSKDLDQTPTWGRCLCLHCFHLDILNSGEKPSRSGNVATGKAQEGFA